MNNVTLYKFMTPWNKSLQAYGRDNTSDMNTLISSIKEDEYCVGRLPEKKDGIAIDLGMHIGAVTLALASRGYKVYGAEVLPENVALANKNIALNNFQKQVRIYPFAITEKTGDEITAYYSDTKTASGKEHEFVGTIVKGSIGMAGTTPGREIRVQTLSLEDIFVNNSIERCDFMKIDIESGEWDIFEGTSREIINSVDRYAVEIDGRNGKDATTGEFLELLGDQFIDVSKEYFPKWCMPGPQCHGYFLNKRLL